MQAIEQARSAKPEAVTEALLGKGAALARDIHRPLRKLQSGETPLLEAEEPPIKMPLALQSIWGERILRGDAVES